MSKKYCHAVTSRSEGYGRAHAYNYNARIF